MFFGDQTLQKAFDRKLRGAIPLEETYTVPTGRMWLNVHSVFHKKDCIRLSFVTL
jgi:hypothetical protein